MTEGLKLVIVGGVLLIAAALVSSGIYTTHSIGYGQTFIVNRLTGAAWVCRPTLQWKCLPAGEAPPKVAVDDWVAPQEPQPSVAKSPNPFDQFDKPSTAGADR